MSHEHPNLVVVFFRAAIYGVVMGLAVGLVVSVFLSIMEPPFDWTNVMVATAAGAFLGLVTGLIMALLVSVVGVKHSDKPALRVVVSLMVIFVVGGLVGLIGVNAAQVAMLFGLPAAVAAWIVYPKVLATTPKESLSGFDRS